MHKTRYFTRLVFLLAITLTVESIGLPQFFTGPFINFMLILTTLLLDFYGGVALGCITPLVALLRGQLPAVLWPAVPFIAAGNALFIILFFFLAQPTSGYPLLHRWRTWIALFSAAVVKFAWLYFAVSLLLPLLLARPVDKMFSAMMAAPQLLTALIGGGLALMFYTLLQGRKIL